MSKKIIQYPDNFAYDYLYSLYFYEVKKQELDSSYLFINSCIEKFSKSGVSLKHKYKKLNIDSAEIFKRKKFLDSLGFSFAQKQHTERAYHAFRLKFPTAEQVPEAIKLRNQLAFQEAKLKNTYEAYLAFLDKYPEAQEAVNAKELVDLILFEQTAIGGKLQNWVEFIQQNPDNPYLSRAEDRIFEIATVSHKPEAYYKFAIDFPKNPNVEKAWKWIIFLEPGIKSVQAFKTKYPQIPADSFKTVIDYRSYYLFPIIFKGKYGFINQDGYEVFSPIYDSIPDEYKCSFNVEDYFKFYSKGFVNVQTMDLKWVTKGDYHEAEYFSPGILRVKYGKKYGLISLFGEEILSPKFDSLVCLKDLYVVAYENGKKSLLTMKGQRLNLNNLDFFSFVGDYLLVGNNGKYALLSNSDLLQRLENYFIQPNFKYNSFKELSNERYLLFANQSVDLLSESKARTILNTGADDGDENEWGYQFRHGATLEITDSVGNLVPEIFDYARVTQKYAIVKFRGRWGVVDKNGKFLVEAEYDSINLVSDRCHIFQLNGKNTVRWDFSKVMPIKGPKSPEKLFYTNPNGKQNFFISFADSLGRKGLYSPSGRNILKHNFEQITILNGQLLAYKINGKTGIADTLGNLLTKPIFDAIGPCNSSLVNIVKNQKFGIYNLQTRQTTALLFDGLVKPYSNISPYLKASKNGKYGLVDFKAATVIPFLYDELQYWTEKVVLVRKDLDWFFLDITKNELNPRPFKNLKILIEKEDKVMVMVETEGKFGLFSNQRGFIIPAEFEEILPVYLNDDLYFFTSRKIIQSTNYNVAYYTQEGKLVRTQIISASEYERIVCN